MKIEDIFSSLPNIKTERLLLRKLEYSDVEDIYGYAQHTEVAKYVSWEQHASEYETLEFMNFIVEKYNKQQVAPWGIEHKKDEKIIGTIGFSYWDIEHARSEIGYTISNDYWNNGYATEAVKAVLHFGFKKMSLNRIEARCEILNIPSAKVMEKAGMKFEGILRQQMFIKDKYILF